MATARSCVFASISRSSTSAVPTRTGAHPAHRRAPPPESSGGHCLPLTRSPSGGRDGLNSSRTAPSNSGALNCFSAAFLSLEAAASASLAFFTRASRSSGPAAASAASTPKEPRLLSARQRSRTSSVSRGQIASGRFCEGCRGRTCFSNHRRISRQSLTNLNVLGTAIPTRCFRSYCHSLPCTYQFDVHRRK